MLQEVHRNNTWPNERSLRICTENFIFGHLFMMLSMFSLNVLILNRCSSVIKCTIFVQKKKNVVPGGVENGRRGWEGEHPLTECTSAEGKRRAQ